VSATTTDRRPTEVSHLQQLRKAKIDYPKEDAYQQPRIAAQVRELLDKTEHFVFTSIPDDSEDIHASAQAMDEAGVWRLPYPVCTFEFSAVLTLGDDPAFGGTPFRIICILEEDKDTKAPWLAYTFIRAHPTGKTWVAIQHLPVDVPAALSEEERADYVRGFHSGSNVAVSLRLIDGDHEMEAPIQSILSTCMVMLATRGIRRERWVGDKKVLIGRKEPSNTYTRVMVAEASEAQGHKSSPGERYRVRLHLRRGHTRQQPHGPGRRFTRAIWIEPMLVGYAEEGTVHHDHYETYPESTS
jgi:hypothetical protein